MTIPNAARTGESDSEGRKTSALCWTARIVPLIVVIPLVPWSFYVLLFTSRNDSPPLLAEAAFLIPTVSALVAWKWHLLGGILLSIIGILVIAAPLILTGLVFLLVLFGAVLLCGGMLHLLVWWQEDRRVKPRQIKPASGPATPLI